MTEPNVENGEIGQPVKEPPLYAKYVHYLYGLAKEGRSKAAFAVLERSLSRPYYQNPQAFRWVSGWSSQDHPTNEPWYFLLAALFATYPVPGGRGNLGRAMAELARVRPESKGAERRMIAMINMPIETLPDYLRGTIALLKREGILIDWIQLMRDLLCWSHPEHFVQAEWAREFWGATLAVGSILDVAEEEQATDLLSENRVD